MRIAIVGGTFDPIHIGHLAVADDVRRALDADQVLFVPTAQQPLKPQQHCASAKQRLAMVQHAIADNAAFRACDLEVRRGGKSYSVETVAELRTRYPDSELFWVLGADAVALLPQWYQVERLLQLCRLAVVERPGYPLDLEAIEQALPAARGRLVPVTGPRLDISASEIRQRLAQGLPVRYLLPAAVWHYVEQHGLYCDRTQQ